MKRPIVWFASAWLLGMAAASASAAIGVAVIAVVVSCLAYTAHGANRSAFAAALLTASAAAIGGGWYERTETLNVSALPASAAEQTVAVQGAIASPPVSDGDRATFDVSAAAIELEGRSLPLTGERMKVYVRFESEADKAAASAWRRGDAATVTGTLRLPMEATNFGGFDYRNYLRLQRTHWTLQAEGFASVRIEASSGMSVGRALGYVDLAREKMGAAIDGLYLQPSSGFMKGLLLGVRDDLDPERFQSFSQIGLTHILAISGLHVGIYVATVLWLLSRLPITKERRLVLAMAAVPLYVVLTGASPSVLRAGIMAVIALYAARRGLLKDGLHVLAAAALLMTAWNPLYVHNVSFQLSFAVTAGLIVGVPLADERLRWIRSLPLRSAASVTLVAQLVSFPLTVYYFNGFSLLSLPANFVMVPLFSFAILPLGAISLLLAIVCPPAAPAVAWCAERLTTLSFAVVERLNAVEGASTIWATPPLWWIAGYYVSLYLVAAALCSRLPGGMPRPAVVAACAGLALTGLLAYGYAPQIGDRHAYISFLDVGQGDAIYIRTPYGKHALIDAGGTVRFEKPGDEWKRRKDPFEVGRDVVVPLLMRRGVHALDAVFVTHADADHIGGMRAVIDRIPVRRLWMNGTAKRGAPFERMVEAALERNVPITPAYAGMDIELDPETTIRVLYPKVIEGLPEVKEQNEISLVFLLTVYSRTFLFTGDVGVAEEEAIVKALAKVNGSTTTTTMMMGDRIDVLKVAHHGSKTSTSATLLEYFDPVAATVSVGRKNIYRHPHPTVVDRLRETGTMIYRTDEQGEVQFRVGRDGIRVRTMMEGK
ncbi:DNA internalization-related competence protein ComEC/Rec2 [Paenibacillus sp. TRM 82003]|nr:DNA internalization-related competence protein ComEC/Rec2 [Paenibacillus sp. TRM 82003]